MRRILVVILVLLVPATLTFGGCSDDGGGGGNGNGTGTADTGSQDGTTGGDDADTGGNGGDTETDATEGCSLETPRAISGTLRVHPATAQIDSNVTVENSQITLYNALAVLRSGAEAEPLALGTDSGPCGVAQTTITSTETSASFSLDPVDVDPVTGAGGLVSIVDDGEGNSDNFVPTATGLATLDQLSSDLEGATSFAVSNSTVDKIAEISSKSKSELMDAGIILGVVTDGDGNPASGVKVGLVDQGEVAPLDDAIYPNADFTGATAGADDGSTSGNGVFVIPDKSLKTFGGTQGQGSVDTTTQPAATTSGVVFTMVLSTDTGS